MAVEYVKQSAFGGYKEVTTHEDSMEWTHVAMPRVEYYELLEEVQLADQDAENAEKAAEERVARIKKWADAEIEKVRLEGQGIIEQLRQELSEARQGEAYHQGLNKTLLWMQKKRANADRGLRPKKAHSGYVVLSSVEKDHLYGSGKKRKSVRVWETVLQTPFSTDFTEEQARVESRGLFAKTEDGKWLIGKIGISGVELEGYEAILEKDDVERWLRNNVLFDAKYRANHKAGYWEMLLLHTHCLGVVPEEMRPQSKTKK